jgi:hypothetical protein
MRDFPIPIRSGVNIERPMNKNIVKRILSIGLAEIKDVAVLVLPGFSTAFSLADIESSKNIDDRVARLDKIKADLEAAIRAVEQLQGDAHTSKIQVDRLRKDIANLQQDKATAEQLSNVSEESFARVLSRATRKATRTGIIAGIIIGLVTGIVSGYAVWFTTKGDAVKFSHSTPSKAPAASPNTK